jgi:tRNA A-37 threonylcarbamoyl transferase component Bud32
MTCEACGHDNVEGARFCAKCGALQPTEHKGPDPLVGQLIGGRYRVTGVLGEGGMGKVYVGEQQMGSTVRKVAIKTLHSHLSKDPSVLARFHRECGTVAQLEHPNTIKFYDFGATPDGTLYIAMEFVDGKPLSDVIAREGALDPERVVKILRQASGALDEAHGQGIIHRDLKPDNIVLTNRAGETDFVKVLDFGIAARSESTDAQKEQKLTQQGTVLGTPPYMSPEQFTGKALDARSDIYSLGVMAYEMLAGKLPFDADTPWQWATQHMTAQPTPFEVAAPSRSIPQGMRDAILKALSKDREKRQATCREFFSEISGGARMTVAQKAELSGAATAAMPEMPDFGAVAAPMAAAPMGSPPANYHAPHTGPAVVAGVPAPPPPAEKGGGKGLILGLGALGALLLVAMAVVAARSMKPEEDPPPLALGPNPTTTTTQATGTSGEATIAPLDTQTAPTATPTATDTVATATPSATSTATGKATSTGTTATAKPPAGKDPCDACLAAAASGNASAAAGSFSKCTDAAKKQACTSAIKKNAGGAAKAAANNGNCSQANAIIAAAKGMGAGSGLLDKALKGTSCAK